MSYQSEAVKSTQRTKLTLIRRYRDAIGCTRCGERRLGALDLHHRDPSTKLPKLSKVKGTGRYSSGGSRWVDLSYTEIIAELAKCDVVCSNCHRVERAEEEKWRTAKHVEPKRVHPDRTQLERLVESVELSNQP